MTDILDPLAAPDPVTTKWIPLGNVGSGVPLPAVNGQWIKGVGGVPVWSSIGVGDLPTGIPPANIGGGYAPNKVTVGTIAAGPPASPATNDIWIATDVDAFGTCWHFRYNAAEATYKWEFIGGPDKHVYLPADETTTVSGSFQDLATLGPSFTTPRGGDYLVAFGMNAYLENPNMNAQAQLWNAATGALTAFTGVNCAATATGATGVHTEKVANIGSGVELRVRYQMITAGTQHFRYRWLRVQPVRVS